MGTMGYIHLRSIKVGVKKKHVSFGWSFSCFAAHLIDRGQRDFQVAETSNCIAA
jgi:hypothetical protein